MLHLGRHPVLGVPISALDYESAAEIILDAAVERRAMAVTCAAVHGVTLGALRREHRHRLNRFEMIVPDGQPVRWALRWLHGVSLPDRVRGADLLPFLCERAAGRGIPIFLYGSSDAVASRLRARLLQRFPTLRIVGSRPSLFRSATEVERQQIAADIRRSGAQLVLVGLGCPRQEIWIFENRDLLRMPLVGIGSAFDTNAGVLPQPPQWMQRRGLEWLWRLGREPRRLWRRYLILNPLYLLLVAAERLRIATFDDGGDSPPTPRFPA